jgi:hypothetical protein
VKRIGRCGFGGDGIRPVPEPSFAQRYRASGMGGNFDAFFVERAQEFVMSKSEILSR